MWVQLCVNCDTVFARATKTHWYYHSNGLVIYDWIGINHTPTHPHTHTHAHTHTQARKCRCACFTNGRKKTLPQLKPQHSSLWLTYRHRGASPVRHTHTHTRSEEHT